MAMLDRAKHEFGHYVVSRAVGFKPGAVSAELNGAVGGTSEIDTFRRIASIEDMEKFCEDRVKVLYAGVLAESLEDGKVINDKALSLAADSGRGDHMMVQQLCNILRNIRYSTDEDFGEAKMKDDERRLWQEAAEMVEARADLITLLAQELYDRRAHHGRLAIFTAAELIDHPALQGPTQSTLQTQV